MIEKLLSREFLIALVVAVAGVVKLFISVPDDLLTDITSVVVVLVPVIVYAIVRTVQKSKGV